MKDWRNDINNLRLNVNIKIHTGLIGPKCLSSRQAGTNSPTDPQGTHVILVTIDAYRLVSFW